jgi:CRP/FNR family transcriptional regulator
MATPSAARSNYRPQIFSGLAPDEMSRVVTHARSLRKGRGEFIYMPGDCPDFVYILKQGRVKLSVLSESGREIAIDIIQPGEIFGEFALVDESPRSNMAQALDDILMWVFSRQDFTQLLASQSKLALSYIRLVGDRRRRMEKKLSDITSKAVSARVCELLHELSTSTAEIETTSNDYLVPLTHHDVASLASCWRHWSLPRRRRRPPPRRSWLRRRPQQFPSVSDRRA